MKYLVIVLGLAAALSLAGCGGGDGGSNDDSGLAGASATPAQATEETATTPAGVPTASPTPAASPTAAPLAVRDGDRVRIPKLGIEAPLRVKVVATDGNMPNPDDDASAAIYDFGAFGEQYGGSPEGGNAIIASFYHRQDGPRLFFPVLELTPGDAVEVIFEGTAYEYTIGAKCEVPSAHVESIFQRTQSELLTLFPAASSSGNQFVLRADLGDGSSATCLEGWHVFTGDRVPPPNQHRQ